MNPSAQLVMYTTDAVIKERLVDLEASATEQLGRIKQISADLGTKQNIQLIGTFHRHAAVGRLDWPLFI